MIKQVMGKEQQEWEYETCTYFPKRRLTLNSCTKGIHSAEKIQCTWDSSAGQEGGQKAVTIEATIC